MSGESEAVVDQIVDPAAKAASAAEDAQALADFESGYSMSKDPTPTPGPTESETLEGEQANAPAPAPAPAPAAEAPAPAPAPAAEPDYARITAAQWEEIVGKTNSINSVSGTLGALKQTVERLRKETAAGEPVALTEEDVADLSAEYPELAGPTLKVLQKVIGKVRGTAASSEAIEKAVSERMAATQSQLVDSRLDEIVDGDWKAEFNSPAYQAWRKTLSPEIEALHASHDVRDASRVLRMWVKQKTQATAPAPAPTPAPSPAPAPAAPSARQRLLQTSVNPRGRGGAPLSKSADDEFNEGYRQSRRQ